jgi:UDP-N-acetylglucosamine 3-dehydrogenase
MPPFRAAIIGTGRPRGEEGATGAAMSRYHARGYQESGKAEIAALADIRREHAEAFRREQDCPQAQIFTDYREMLVQVKPDVVSVVTWPHLHAEMVTACAEAGVRAVHCEKPMAPTWGEAKRMHQACVERGTQLTFNHQRRFEAPYRTARRLIREGAVGRLIQMQAACPNLIDWGTHWFDMLAFYNDDVPATWVMGQLDARHVREVFGVRLESQGLSYFAYQNGVRGLLITGDNLPDPEASAGPTSPAAPPADGRPERPPRRRGARPAMHAAHRIIGTEGVLEVGAPGSRVRLLNGAAAGYQEVPLDPAPDGVGEAIAAGIADVLACLESGTQPELSSHKAIRTTELIFATYESSRRRARVDLPLEISDNPLHALLDSGALTLSPAAQERG